MFAVADEWYRSPTWDDDARADFERRLSRARKTGRQQYLLLKASKLRSVGKVEAARELLHRATEEPDGLFFHVVEAWQQLAELAAQRGDRSTAVELYRRILTEGPDVSGTDGNVEIALAELLLDTGSEEERAEASELLSSWLTKPQTKFNHSQFHWHLAAIRVAQSAGDREAARRSAIEALNLAGSGAQFARHKDVGLVQTDRATLQRLRQLAK